MNTTPVKNRKNNPLMLNPALLTGANIHYYALNRVKIDKNWHFMKKTSPFTRLYYIIDGTASVKHQHAEVNFKPNHLVVIPPFIPVDYICDSSCEKVYIHFTCQIEHGFEVFSQALNNYIIEAPAGTDTYINRLVDINPDMGLREHNPSHPDYNELMWKSSRNLPSLSHQIESQGLLRILLAPFFESFATENQPIHDRRLYDALLYIEQNIGKDLSLKKLSEITNLHENYFSDLFHKTIGVRPVVYINQRRIEKAQFLLLASNDKIKSIGYKSGFSDSNYFSRTFKKFTGCSPAEYRHEMS